MYDITKRCYRVNSDSASGQFIKVHYLNIYARITEIEVKTNNNVHNNLTNLSIIFIEIFISMEVDKYPSKVLA